MIREWGSRHRFRPILTGSLLFAACFQILVVSTGAQTLGLGGPLDRFTSRNGFRLKASFGYNPRYPVAGQNVQFFDASTGSPATWHWDFGDGTTSTDRHPAHMFASQGFHRVTLAVTNGTGTRTSTRTLTVLPNTAGATFVFSPTTPGPGQTVQFADTTSGNPTSWQWTFGDGGTSTSKNPSHAFASAGSYTVNLTARTSSVTKQGSQSVTVSAIHVLTSSFTFSPTVPIAGQPVQFTDTSTGSPTSWQWSFGDGSSSTAQNPSHTYATAGSKTVTLTVTNSSGSNSTSRTFTVAVPLAAAFNYTPSQPTTGQPVQFTDTSTGSPASWQWSFGDGSSSTSQNPSHSYTTAGAKTVTLTVTNSSGSNSISRSVSVVPALDASFTFSPASPTAGQTVQFTDTSTGSPSIWQWSFGDGTTSTSQNPSHAYAAAGSYTVALTIMNSSGQDSTTRAVTVAPANTLAASFTFAPASPVTGQSVQFTDTSTGGPTSWQWSFGDGTSSTARNPSHSYSTAGSKTVTLTVTNSTGSNSANRTVIVATPVTASFGFTPSSPVTGESVLFTDTSTGSPTAWQWNFNDGSTSTSQNPSHAFSAAGAYSVTLVASNASGSSSTSQLINVSPSSTLTAGFTFVPAAPVPGQAVQFTDTSTGSPSTWQWNFGDGGTSTARNPVHSFASTGPYAVSLLVGNGSSTNSTSQTVTIVPASAIIPADRRIDWSYCGVPGGIPNRTTIFTTLSPGATSTQINSAISSCPSGQVVYLNAGTYNLSGTINFGGKNGITLRGAGAGQTVINSSASGNVVSTGQVGFSGDMAISSGYTKGSTSIVMSSTPTNFAVGALIRIYQNDDTSLIFTRSGGGGQHFATVHRVTAKAGNTLSIEPPLPYTLTAGLSPMAEYTYGALPTLCGIEGLTINSTAGANDIVDFYFADRCWLKGVELSGAGNSFVFVYGSLQCEVNRCFMHSARGTPNNSDGFGVYLYESSTYCLTVDNIFTTMFCGILYTASSCNAALHNFTWNLTAYNLTWTLAGINPNHGAHGMMNLFEGNVTEQFQNDGYHGSGSHNTLFRNWVNGLHPTNSANRKMVDLCRWSYYHNAVGNVLGASGWTPAAYEMSGEQDYSYSCIYRLGYPDMGGNGLGAGYPDTKVKATLLRHGNYDFYNHSTVWDPAIADHVIPASLFYSSKPAYFGSLQWPPIGPDVPGYVTDIPAKARWNAYQASGRVSDLF